MEETTSALQPPIQEKASSDSKSQEMQNKEAKPAVDAARSVDTGVMAATVLNGTLVDVLALQCVNVQSAGGQEFFLLQSKV